MVRGRWCGDGADRLVFIGRKVEVCGVKFPLPRGKSFLDLLQQQGTKRCNGRDFQLTTTVFPFPGSFLMDLFSSIHHSPRQGNLSMEREKRGSRNSDCCVDCLWGEREGIAWLTGFASFCNECILCRGIQKKVLLLREKLVPILLTVQSYRYPVEESILGHGMIKIKPVFDQNIDL